MYFLAKFFQKCHFWPSFWKNHQKKTWTTRPLTWTTHPLTWTTTSPPAQEPPSSTCSGGWGGWFWWEVWLMTLMVQLAEGGGFKCLIKTLDFNRFLFHFFIWMKYGNWLILWCFKTKIHYNWYLLIFSQMGSLFEAKLDELVLFVLRHDENLIFLVISIHFRTKIFYAIFWS